MLVSSTIKLILQQSVVSLTITDILWSIAFVRFAYSIGLAEAQLELHNISQDKNQNS